MKKLMNFINKYKLYLILFGGIILFTVIFYDKVYEMFTKDTENMNVVLVDDTDFYDWFIQFDELYNRKKDFGYPRYSVNKEMFLNIVNLLEDKSDISYRDGKYYINDNETIELDCVTRSFRYTNNETNEIMEVNLINGKYYMQLLIGNKLYKIILSNNKMIKKEKSSKDYNSIYGLNDFGW